MTTDPSQIQQDLELLRSWAPLVLSAGPEASRSDLAGVIEIRARLGSQMLALVEEGNVEAFIATLTVDPLCAEHCHNLLYLTREEAQAAAEAGGGTLNPVSWYGVHEWAVYPHLEHWSTQVSLDHHPSEILHALIDLLSDERDYVYENFYNSQGQWLSALNEPEVEVLTQLILENRNV